jgi:hypothetical protein
VPRQQRLERSLPAVECCRLETLERCCEVDQAAAGRKIEHPQRAGDGKAAAAGDADTFTIVHKHQLGLDGQREALSPRARHRRASPRNIVGARMTRPHVKPA